jgi:hypothetical protein
MGGAWLEAAQHPQVTNSSRKEVTDTSARSQRQRHFTAATAKSG